MHKPVALSLVPAGLALALASLPARATDVAFWQEYGTQASDEACYLHAAFDDEAPRAVDGPIRAVEPVGRVLAEPAGRFGAALRLEGDGALRCTPTNIYAGGFVSLEAWIKLDRLPDTEAWIVHRPGVVDRSPKYDPAADRTKGFGLLVDSNGAFHLETVNCFYGRRTRTSSPAGTVPTNVWVHVAGVSAVFPVTFRRLYLNGREILAQPVGWGEGLKVTQDEEMEPGPMYIGNNARGDAGLRGAIDQVRVHQNVVRFWPREDLTWTRDTAGRVLPEGPPFFVEDHQPIAYLPLDGDARLAIARGTGATATVRGGAFVDGVRGRGSSGAVGISGPGLVDLREGSVEFWFQPAGFNNYSDRNVGMLNSPFTIYIFNGGEGPRPISLYYATGSGAHFVNDTLGTDVYPGAWYHIAATWRGPETALYVNGRPAGRSGDVGLAEALQRDTENSVALNAYGRGVVDEVRLYDHALLPEEVVNAYWRYRDPGQMRGGVRLPAVEIRGEYLPSDARVAYRLTPNLPPGQIRRLALTLARAGETVRRAERAWSETGVFHTGDLPDGDYTLGVTAVTTNGERRAGGAFAFVRKPFAWEGNTLGITAGVDPPFTPLRARGTELGMVSRTYRMNGFGLCDAVVTLDRDILAAPMRLRFEIPRGEGTWTSAKGRWLRRGAAAATYSGRAAAGPVTVAARTTIEVDGCARVEMTLEPGPTPDVIRRLWVEIPLRAAEVPLMHTIGDGLRHNYSGAAPAGTGVVWNGSAIARSPAWRNGFVPYVWLGAEERGLAFFAENDRGWVTAKDKSEVPTHEMIREGDRLTLRAYLVNRPVVLAGARHLVFGFQASPTKPMPENWRRTLPDCPGGLAVVPWGGLQCPSQGPFDDDWSIVDKLLECRTGKPFDAAWFNAYAEAHRPPLIHGTTDWGSLQGHFAGNIARASTNRPVAVYQEEMAAACSRPEWIVFQDEWKTGNGPQWRTAGRLAELGEGHRTLSDNAGVSFVRSYADFGVWMANEWLRRGVSLYWDNTYPKLVSNTRTTAAYACEDGHVQPCLVIWGQREYQKRVWHVLQYWRRRRPEPLEWTLHMTNTQLLPIHTWGTVNLDHELGSPRPFPPDWLRTETIGRQVGNCPLSLYPVAGCGNARFEALPEAQRERIEWGLRAVHEIQRSGPLERLLTDFGYGTPAVAVHNYWEETPAVAVSSDGVKWLALERRNSAERLIVLASWSEAPVEATVTLAARRGSALTGAVVDAENGETFAPRADQPFRVSLQGPWGVRILRVGAL